MLRAIPLLILLAACAPPDPVKTPTVTNETETESGKSSETHVASPIMGPRIYARDSEAIDADLTKLEEAGRPTDPAELARFEGEVGMKLRHIDVNLRALEVSIKAEAIQTLQESYKVLIRRKDRINKEIDTLWREILEIDGILEAKRKGTGRIPPGYTEDELKDNKGELESDIHKLKQQESEVLAQLERLYEHRKNQTAPDQGTTALTQERKVLQALRTRAEKLLQKS